MSDLYCKVAPHIKLTQSPQAVHGVRALVEIGVVRVSR